MREISDSSKVQGRFLFRGATVFDTPQVEELLRHLGYHVSLSRLERTLAGICESSHAQCVLATIPLNDLVVGMMTLRVFPCLRLGGEQVSIEELVVHADWRGQGLGRSLTDYAIAYAKSRQAVRIEVLTSESRESTQRGFYEKAGFQRAASRVYRLNLSTDNTKLQPVHRCPSDEQPGVES